MTFEQKVKDERRLAYAEGREEGRAEGREEGIMNTIAALKGLLEPAVIAEKCQLPLTQVLQILGQT